MSEIIKTYGLAPRYSNIKIGDEIIVLKIIGKKPNNIKENNIYAITEVRNCRKEFCNDSRCPHRGIVLKANGYPLCNMMLANKRGVKYVL